MGVAQDPVATNPAAVPFLSESKIMAPECHAGTWVRSGARKVQAPLHSGGGCIPERPSRTPGGCWPELAEAKPFSSSDLSLLIPAASLEPDEHRDLIKPSFGHTVDWAQKEANWSNGRED